MAIVWLALIGAAFVTVLLGAIRLLVSRQKTQFSRGFFTWLGIIFGMNFILDLLILYFTMPAFAGPYGGWDWLFWPIVLSGILSLALNGVVSTQRLIEMLTSQRTRVLYGMGGRDQVVNMKPPSVRSMMGDGAGAAGIISIVTAFFMVIIVSGIITVATTWFDPNAKALAAIPQVHRVQSSTLPPTDVKHIVLVTQGVAAFKGQQVLGQNGKNLGSKYHFEQTEYTLQSINQHLYWIAPLVYNNIWANLGNYDTPGFVVVDAENPDAAPQLRDTYHMHYVPDALFNQELTRHVYLSGYTNGTLADPTLEVDDSWHPYFTISLLQPSRGFTGDILHKVLLVDPQSGDITSYDPQDVPAWVDRVVPSDLVNEYLGWYGKYHAAPWFNLSGAGQEKPASAPELVYNNVDQPVWLVPTTSSSVNDSSSTGVILFDTKNNQANYYPLTGLGVGDNVKSTFANNPHNLQHYDVTSVQLYDIYNEPTWVGIFTQSNSQGDTYQAVGLVYARDLNGGSVQMYPSLDNALTAYQQWLANKSSNSPGATGTPAIQVQGKVTRIAPVATSDGTVYYISIEGQSHIFLAPLSLSPLLPLVQPGDVISGSYHDNGQQVVHLESFSDPSIPLATPAPTPVSTPATGK